MMRQLIKNFLVKRRLEDRAWRTIKILRKLKQRLLWPLDKFFYCLLRAMPPSYRLKFRDWSSLVKKMDYERAHILIHIDSGKEYRTRRHSAAKEPETVAWIENRLQPNEIFYDIGACVGAYSLIAAKYFKNQVKIFAFEPGFQNFAQLVKNIALNNCLQSITPLPVALSDKTGLETFNYRNLATGSASHTLSGVAGAKPFQPVLSQPVLVYRLDDFIAQFQLPRPHHIKIDVDGAETMVLSGLSQTLASGHVKSVLVETGDRKEQEVIRDFMAGKGFYLEKSHPKKGSEMANCVFLKR